MHGRMWAWMCGCEWIGAFEETLRIAGLIDDVGRWAGGETVLVQVGDIFDRWAQRGMLTHGRLKGFPCVSFLSRVID